jgi:hypothetical protein
MTVVRIVVFSLLTIGAAAMAAAQSGPHRVFLEGGAAVVHQSGAVDGESVTYVTAPGGATLGWSVGGGVRVAPAASVHVELAGSGLMAAREPSRYGMTFNEERRDRFLTLGVGFPIRLATGLALAPFAGVAITFPQAWSQVDYASDVGLTPPPPGPRITHRLDRGVGPAFGVDALVGRGRVSVVPSFRMLRTAVDTGRYDDSPESPRVEIASIYPGGYPTWTLRTGLVLRLQL